MKHEMVLEQFFEALINGDKEGARQIVQLVASRAELPQDLIPALFWPAHEMVEKLFRNDKLSRLSHHSATRLLRVLVDQLASGYVRQPSNGRSVLAISGRRDEDELAGQMAVDLLEAAGYGVRFAGGGIPADEVFTHVNEARPDLLIFFASAPDDLPVIRQVIDRVRDIGACPNLQIVVGGGVFNRTDGLALEIGADLWAVSPLDLVETLTEGAGRKAAAEQRTVGRRRRRNAA